LSIVKVGLCGHGYWGRNLLRTFSSDPRFEVVAVSDIRDDNPRRYVWKTKGEDILRKIDAARQALVALRSASNAISETAH